MGQHFLHDARQGLAGQLPPDVARHHSREANAAANGLVERLRALGG